MNINYYRCALVKEREIEYTIEDPDGVVRLAKSLNLTGAAEEYLYLLCLNTKGKVMGVHEVAHGSLHMAAAHPREIFKRALLNNAASVIVMHNHPSGDVNPSHDDLEITRRLVECGALLSVPIVDHVIISESGSYSIRANDRELFIDSVS